MSQHIKKRFEQILWHRLALIPRAIQLKNNTRLGLRHKGSKTFTIAAVALSALFTCGPLTIVSAEWAPPPPAADEFDWVQLDSDEWLKGRIKSMQDSSLEFDSDNLGLLNLDWEDVKVIRSPRSMSVQIGRGMKITGSSLLLSGSELKIQAEDETAKVLNYPKYAVVGFAPSGDTELDLWTTKLSAGITVRSGNTQQFDYNTRLTAKRITASSRFGVDYTGSYSEANGIESLNSHRVNSEFDLFLTKRFFYRVPSIEYFRDPFTNIDHRLTLGLGVGYEIIDTQKTNLNITFGPAYQQTIYSSSNEGQNNKQGSAALNLTSDFERDLTNEITFIAAYKGQLSNPNTGESTHHLEARFELELTQRLDLDLGWVYDFTSSPREDGNGDTPNTGDFRFTTSLGYEY